MEPGVGILVVVVAAYGERAGSGDRQIGTAVERGVRLGVVGRDGSTAGRGRAVREVMSTVSASLLAVSCTAVLAARTSVTVWPPLTTVVVVVVVSLWVVAPAAHPARAPAPRTRAVNPPISRLRTVLLLMVSLSLSCFRGW
jgi:hypothetical protein